MNSTKTNKQIINIDSTNTNLLKDIYIEFMDETHTGRPENFDKAAEQFITNKEGHLAVIVSDNIPAGFVEFRKLPRKLRDNNSIFEITSLFVKNNFRKLGLGNDLVNYVKEFAKNSGAYSIVLYSGLELENAHKFYEKVGFVKSAYYFKMPVDN